MRRLVLALLLMPAIGTVRAEASGNLGIGVILGDPTGVSLKLWMSERTALVGGAAWSFRHDGSLHLHGDYLVHHDLSDEVKNRTDGNRLPGVLRAYYGVGGRLQSRPADDIVSVRFPLGLAYAFTSPLDFFVEVVPLLDLAPETDFDMNAALGMRFFF